MTDQDKAAPDRRSARSNRKSPEIALKAIEAVVIPVEPVVDADAAATVEAVVQSAEPVIPDVSVSEPNTITPAPKASLAGPMAIAAVIGGLLGTVGGAFVPSLLGSGPSSALSEIQKLRQTVATLESRSIPVTNPAEMQAMQQRITGLEGDMAKRLTETEKRLSDRLASVETGVKAVEASHISGIGASSPSVDLSPLTQRLGAMEQNLKAIDGKAEASVKASEPRIAALSERVEQATRRMESGTAAPLFTAVQGLAQAFHRGGSFTAELTAVELMGAKPDQLAAMKPFAEKGAPTIQQLGAGFAAFAGSLAQSGEAAPSGAMAYLQRFVKVRPVGEMGGNTPPDIVRTIEAALAKGNVTEALSALAKLPEPARMPSANWAKLAGDRDSAAKALTALQDSALTALRTAKP